MSVFSFKRIVWIALICAGLNTNSACGDWYLPANPLASPANQSEANNSHNRPILAELFDVRAAEDTTLRIDTYYLERVALTGLSRQQIYDLQAATSAYEPVDPISVALTEYPPTYGLFGKPQNRAKTYSRVQTGQRSSMPVMGSKIRSLENAGFITVSHKTVAQENLLNFDAILTPTSLNSYPQRDLSPSENDQIQTCGVCQISSLLSRMTFTQWISIGALGFVLINLRRMR